jgi:hypothetical protein
MRTTLLAVTALSVQLLGCAREQQPRIIRLPCDENTASRPSASAPAVASTQTPQAPPVAGTESAYGSCGAEAGRMFSNDYPFNRRVDAAPLDEESAKIVGYLHKNHNGSQRFRIDGPSEEPDNKHGITLLRADATTTRRKFEPTEEFYNPDCDAAPPPLPAGGAVEAEASYACSDGGDCHLIVVDSAACRLYEIWRANATASAFRAGCQAVWDLRAPYAETLRGECCTSADAAGLPIAAQMFSANDIAQGEIRHAIRFILPNKHIRRRVYVRPATHSVPETSGPNDAPPYGARLRLKASFDESRLKPAARVVATALKRYGMILSDGGNLTFTAINDRFTKHKWREVGLEPSDLTSLQWSDFEVPVLGTRRVFDNACSCSRSQLSR